jgi:uncharacterized membrane protein
MMGANKPERVVTSHRAEPAVMESLEMLRTEIRVRDDQIHELREQLAAANEELDRIAKNCMLFVKPFRAEVGGTNDYEQSRLIHDENRLRR